MTMLQRLLSQVSDGPHTIHWDVGSCVAMAFGEIVTITNYYLIHENMTARKFIGHFLLVFKCSLLMSTDMYDKQHQRIPLQ